MTTQTERNDGGLYQSLAVGVTIEAEVICGARQDDDGIEHGGDWRTLRGRIIQAIGPHCFGVRFDCGRFMVLDPKSTYPIRNARVS